MSHYAILGASDPEMSAIETLLRECGVVVTYAAVDGVRVHSGNADRANGLSAAIPSGATVIVVECGGSAGDPYVAAGATRADHHILGDPGFGRPHSEFLAASSLGQVISWLAREGEDSLTVQLPESWEPEGNSTDDCPDSGEKVGDITFESGVWRVCVASAASECPCCPGSGSDGIRYRIPVELVPSAR